LFFGKDHLSEVQQDARYWMLVEGAARLTQALAPCVAHFLFIKSAEYHVNPVSSIKFLGRFQAQRFFPNNMVQLYTKRRDLKKGEMRKLI
jgi:hypothetical protein